MSRRWISHWRLHRVERSPPRRTASARKRRSEARRVRVGLVIADGVGIRNFLCSNFIDLVRADASVVIWHALSPSTLSEHQARYPQVAWKEIPQIREGIAARVLRQAKVYGQLYWRYEEDAGRVQFGMRPWARRLPPRIIQALARGLGRWAARPRRLATLDRLHARSLRHAPEAQQLRATLADEAPDVLFCTHQRSSRAAPLMQAARDLGIPTANFIYSWDNLPKGRMAVPADAFLVWSAFMREELLTYYPEIDPSRIMVTGSPQFEPYFDPALRVPRKAFCATHGLDPERAIVCFSGDDVSTSPNDPRYLEDLAAALRTLPESERPQLLFRRCPVDTSDRYDSVLERFPEISVSDPLWQASDGDWSSVVPTPADIALLSNVVFHCALVVNVGSTMAMDFAILGKPAIYIAYDPPNPRGIFPIADIYRLPHFRIVDRLQPVAWARTANALADLVRDALQHPSAHAAARQAWLDSHIRAPIDEASQRCAEALRQLARRQPRSPHHASAGRVRSQPGRDGTLSSTSSPKRSTQRTG